jgi:hypothetical protein
MIKHGYSPWFSCDFGRNLDDSWMNGTEFLGSTWGIKKGRWDTGLNANIWETMEVSGIMCVFSCR